MLMRVTVKLFAFLSHHLPPGSEGQVARMSLPPGTTLGGLIDRLGVPEEHCHLVLLDGHYVAPGERPARPLGEGQVVAIWPMIAGG